MNIFEAIEMLKVVSDPYSVNYDSKSEPLKDFDKDDYMAFPGVESDSPKIGAYGEWIIIVDGDRAEFIGEDINNCYTLSLSKN